MAGYRMLTYPNAGRRTGFASEGGGQTATVLPHRYLGTQSWLPPSTSQSTSMGMPSSHVMM